MRYYSCKDKIIWLDKAALNSKKDPSMTLGKLGQPFLTVAKEFLDIPLEIDINNLFSNFILAADLF